jgi:hypothetical protein
MRVADPLTAVRTVERSGKAGECGLGRFDFRRRQQRRIESRF